MKKRDLAALLLSVFALSFSIQREGTFSFHKAWYHPITTEKELAALDEVDQLPKPLVVDLNGDGHLEVVVATAGYKLQLIQPAAHGRFGEGFAQAEVLAEVSLASSKVAMGQQRWPVAMAAGHLDPPPREQIRPPRKQVLVVVTASWRLLAFDHNLKLMWEQPLHESLPPHASVREVAVSVSPHRVKAQDRGLIVVGGSIRRGDLQAAEAGALTGGALEGVLEQEEAWEASEAGHAHSAAAGAEGAKAAGGGKTGADSSRHFSYFAFEGGGGQPRWSHTASSFHRSEDVEAAAEEVTPQHSFRMAAERLEGRHYGELSCRDFREAVLHSLPHRWVAPGDTHLEQAVFARQREGAGAQKQVLAAAAAAAKDGRGRAGYSAHQRARRAAAQRGSLFNWGHVFGKRHQARQGSHAAAHAGLAHRHAALAHNLTSANALVAHLEEGLEVVHLFTGRTLCQLHLAPGALHADINSDGVIEHVAVTGGGSVGEPALQHPGTRGHVPLGRCQALVTSGIPPRDLLWAVRVCPTPGSGVQWGDLLGHDAGEEQGQPVKVLPAVMLPVPRADGTYSHLRGQGGLLVFFNSRGSLGAFNSFGMLIWQTNLDLAWDEGEGAGLLPGASKAVPSLQPMAVWRHALPTAVLATGAAGAALVSEHGHTLARLSLPYPPAAPPLIVDFNGDGLNDLVVVTPRAIFGYAQVMHAGGLQMGALLLALIAAMGVVYWANESDAGGGGGGGARAKLRSTDLTD